MDEQTQKFYSKMFALLCGTAIALYALSLGLDGYLSLAAVVALFGGEKVLDRWINKEATA